MSQIVEVTRSYSGQEAFRVKAGTLFSVGKPAKHAGVELQVISAGRYAQLLKSNLVRTFSSENPPLAQAPRPTYEGQQSKQVNVKQPLQTQRRTDLKIRQEAAPAEPRPLENPSAQAGGATGATGSSSSSPAAPPSKTSTSNVRGNRTARPSRSTTPTKSSPGPKSCTPATGNGGGSTKAQPGSKD